MNARILVPLLAATAFSFATPAVAHGPHGVAAAKNGAPMETVDVDFSSPLPNVPGKSLVAVEVLYPPGGTSPAHTHAKSAFIYAHVLSGQIESGVDDQAPRIYRAGESFHELPGSHHRVSRNVSTTEPAKLLAVFIVDTADTELTTPDK